MKKKHPGDIVALAIQVKGLVQGVGFRPFVYRLTRLYGLHGWVVNTTDGVSIKVEGLSGSMAAFVEDLKDKAPVVSQIEEISVEIDVPEGLQGFFIQASQDMTNETSEISPDIAVCADCLHDMKHEPHRLDYPFINCTNCGPRFSIIRDFPYDRAKTTMDSFAVCERCSEEYSDIQNRRFHAQPVACSHCGPQYEMYRKEAVVKDIREIITSIAEIVKGSGVIALKGTGGFHLMCNALDERAVNRLRKIKQREGKPFAVMFRDINSLKQFGEVNESEEIALTSWRRPVVILKGALPLAKGVAMGLDTIGALLPSMPIHYLLFERLNLPALVLTSGNVANEPIIISNDAARMAFGAITNAVISYNRDIYNRTDDSVVRIISGKERIQRRSRGFAPAPVKLGFSVNGILATGAELSNCFCLGKSDRAYLSQHIGDLKNNETFSFYEESIARFQKLFRIKPGKIAADLHPDYLSTRFARKSGLETIWVQHHHAHIAACMAENGLDEPVIGVAFDGTGYGSDGNTWGSEFMVCEFDRFERYTHFAYMPMPGGDRASEEPWRMGIALLWQTFGHDLDKLDLPLLRFIEPLKLARVIEAIEKHIHCPLTSGAGRLFDAVAAITGICIESRFHAEAPMRLESAVKPDIQDSYEFTLTNTISFLPAIRQICDDMKATLDTGIIAAKFHNTLVNASLQGVKNIMEKTGIQKVVLSGGTFQNKYLLESLESTLVKNNFTVYTHSKVPCNDGGIALGQLAIAARIHNLPAGRQVQHS